MVSMPVDASAQAAAIYSFLQAKYARYATAA